MSIQTNLQPRFKYWNVGYGALCVVLGAWGAWDYWVTIPARESAATEYETAAADRTTLAEDAQHRTLTNEEATRYEEAGRITDSYANAPPVRPPAYDRPLQFWVYFIGCGVLGAPYIMWVLYSASRHRYSMDDDGTLTVDGQVYPPTSIIGIDLSRWMSKSYLTIHTTSGDLILDDYKHQHVSLIAGQLAKRFHFGEWSDDCRPLATEAETEPSQDTKDSAT